MLIINIRYPTSHLIFSLHETCNIVNILLTLKDELFFIDSIHDILYKWHGYHIRFQTQEREPEGQNGHEWRKKYREWND